jgi:neutral ceramidase
MRRLSWLIAVWLVAAALPARAGTLRAGVGRVDITPPVGTPLGGYAARQGAPSTGVHDPIQAKALVLDDGATRVAIVTTDLVLTNPEIVRRVAKQAGIPEQQLLLCSSHTHSGPGAYVKPVLAQIVLGAYREQVFDHLTEGIAAALKQALENVRPAKLAIGETQLPHFMRNRREAKIKDPALWLMRVDTADGKPLAALVDLTAHGTVLDENNKEFSGDWMGFTQALMEKEVPGLLALYANGAEGDISPSIPDNSSHFDGARAHGEIGGRAALELYRTLKPSAQVNLALRTASMELPQTVRSALLGGPKQTFLQCIEVNDALLIAVPGEMITQLGLILKDHARRQGSRYPVIIGLANDHLGYLLTRAEMKKGGYEVGMSFFGDDFGEDLAVSIGKLIGGEIQPLKEALKATRDKGPRRDEGRLQRQKELDRMTLPLGGVRR